MEFVASESNTERAVGLPDANTNANYSTIKYMWMVRANGTTGIYETM